MVKRVFPYQNHLQMCNRRGAQCAPETGVIVGRVWANTVRPYRIDCTNRVIRRGEGTPPCGDISKFMLCFDKCILGFDLR